MWQTQHTMNSNYSTASSSSIFDTYHLDFQNYDSQIKEIEEYYIQTLLNEDDVPSTDYSPPATTIQPTSKLLPPPPGEVRIDSNFKPSSNLLPLTKENLDRLTSDKPNTATHPSHHPHIVKTTTDQSPNNNLNKQLYKTELCESFTTRGVCKYGSKCQFAHGLHELKLKMHSNNFRTKPCINWNKLGYCPYGKRCCFKHGDDRDIQIYLNAGVYTKKKYDELTNKVEQASPQRHELTLQEHKRKNLHAHVKYLQKMTW